MAMVVRMDFLSTSGIHRGIAGCSQICLWDIDAVPDPGVDGINGETWIYFGTDANGDVITLTLVGMTDPALVNISVV